MPRPLCDAEGEAGNRGCPEAHATARDEFCSSLRPRAAADTAEQEAESAESADAAA